MGVDDAASTRAAQILDRISRFYTPLISDAADALGISVGVLDSRSGIVPAFGIAAPVAGWAFPCQNRPTHEKVEIDVLLEMIDQLSSGAFVVVSESSVSGAAQWGGLMSRAAQRRGAVGAICNGPARDWAQIQALQFPVFSNGWTVLDIRSRSEMVAFGIPVEINGVRVSPGDLILADSNGVLVIPRPESVVEELLEWCAEKVIAEERTDQDLAAGQGASDSYRRYGRF